MAEKREPRGIRNNNPLNIRKGSTWKGERPNQSDKQFEEFMSMELGIRAGLRLMRNLIQGFGGNRLRMDTISKLVAVWAPPSENATQRYIRTVCERTGMTPTQKIDPYNRGMMISIARAMAHVECGVWIDREKFETAYDLL